MSRDGSILARAISDAEDRLVSADEPLAGLQLRCGGDLPGAIAIPALLETVRKARRYGMKLARALKAQDGAQQITAWAEVRPREDGEPGCDISIHSWQAENLPAEDAGQADRRRREIDCEFAELSARLDGEQRILAVEAEAPDLAELADAMQAGIGERWTDFVSIEGDSHHQPMHWRLLDGASLSVPGSTRDWRARLLPHEVPGGEPAGFELLLTAQGPAPQGETEAPVEEPEADEKTPARRGLVGRDIAPVLRQPIARIIANAETIRTRLAGPIAEEYADYASDISTAGRHLLALLDDLSDMEVVEAQGFSTARDRIDLADVARQAAGILGVRAQEKRIVIDAPKAGEGLPAVAEFRRALQILLNLVGNAIRYAPEDSQIWIRLEDEGGRARVIVADQGPGLSDDDQLRIFEKFERLGRSGDGGSGLGLYISRRLARAMDGELSVQSAPGQGARFILEVPADTGESIDGVNESDAESPAMPAAPFRLPRIPAPRTPGDDAATPGDGAAED
ncbi:MAG: sensor histidine kinase [Novosphingobium sp.]|nr:sensor histidine kinase [Novosphingobium sp.]MCP5402666.1 sensor histidine kinase [Novosphingobium sp.]